MNYSDKLKDPRWQKKRLKILERDDFTCRVCGSDTKTLNIHHVAYVTVFEPWDCPDGFLLTLCDDCHKKGCDEMTTGNCGEEDKEHCAECWCFSTIQKEIADIIGRHVNEFIKNGGFDKEIHECPTMPYNPVLEHKYGGEK